jgi:hypothetical protein
MSRNAERITAEYLMSQVPEEPLLIQDGPEHVSPLRFVAGFAVVVLVAFVCFWGV